MAEVVATPRMQSVAPSRKAPSPTALPETVFLQGFGHLVAPALAAVLCLVALALTSARVGDLRYWGEIHDGRGDFQVRSCTAATGLGADQWVCDGALVVEGSTTDLRADLVSSLGAVASDRFYVGEQVDVFFDDSELGTAHPLRYRLNESTRLYLSLLPRLLLFVGSAFWLAGWYMTRNLDVSDPVVNDSLRFPRRFSWQVRGLQWIAAGVGMTVVNYLLVTRVIGSLATF